ncbi:MAG TPA: winged helix-turn-helix domain-containing protein [Methanomassiliicoccales archaeon]|jgi:predicted transcriptional regulator
MAEGGSKHRSRSRIFADILRSIEVGENLKITHLLHSANVPHDRLVKYLAQMEKSNLIARSGDGEGTAYTITQKGRMYLVEFKKLEEFSSIFGVEI